MKKTVNFQTKDSVKIVGDYYDAKSLRSVLLLHILPGDRSDFSEFAEFLWQNGYNVLNIDERGHGDSEAWPEEMGSWQEFTQVDYDKMIYDAEAAAQWLENKIPQTKLALVGGSIGANVAMIFGAKHQPKIIVALSPGINYCGIKTEIAARNYRQNLLLVASYDDIYAFESVEKLFEISKASNKEIIKYEQAGHATRMFNAEPELKQQILDFLNNNIGA
ncbi:alpha/beta hydrolase [Patescibacteria group bacterium]|nr:alpha/beta hydrolase [Patescibacteria group bacterium]